MKLALKKRIEEAMPEVRVDEDCGQLASQEELDPVVLPCVLIAQSETEWLPMANRPAIQQGRSSVTLKMALDCSDESHGGTTTEERIAERERMAGRLFQAVQGAKLSQGMSGLDRRRSAEYALGGGIRVYEVTFEHLVRELV